MWTCFRVVNIKLNNNNKYKLRDEDILIMNSESEEDPFGGDNSDDDRDYRPTESSEDSEQDEPNLSLSKGKKRLMKKAEWKRSIRKERRTAGKEYVSTSKAIVPQKQMGNSCNCNMKCFEKVPAATRQKMFDAFYELPTKDLQDSYLCSNIIVKNIARHRQRNDENNKPKSVTCTFYVSIPISC